MEKTPRLDSFQLIDTDGSCSIWSENIEIPAYRDRGVNPEIATIFAFCKAEQDIELSTIWGGHGGEQVFWICPRCGNRRRYIYLIHSQQFACRECARLNYRSQQRTRDSMDGYREGMRFAQERLKIPPDICGFDFAELIPGRPRYMHQTTYARLLRRFSKHQDRYITRMLSDLARMFKIFKR